MNKPDPRPVFSQLGKKSPNSRTPPSKTLLRPSGCALVLLMLAAILTPGTQVQAQTCTGMVGEVRILDGNAVNEGRLEICADKPDDDEGPVWGTVCDDYWTTRNANVACRQLGYTHAQSGAFALLRSHFGPGTGPILLDDIVCNGNEPNLLACPTASGQLARNVVGKHNCKSNETVGIRCLDARTDATLNNLSVRDGNSVVVNLNPEFASARDSYTASVPHTISTVTVFATPTQSEATVEYLDGNDMSLGTGSSVQIQNLAVGATVIKVKVTATDGMTEMVYSVTLNRAAVVNPPPNNPATGQPAINGTLRVDQTLTSTSGTIADVDGLTNAVYEYQWIRVDSSNNENEIFGATGSTYVLTTTDEGQRIRVKARFIDDRSNSEMRTSGRTETVQAAVVNPPPNNPATGQPAINGTLRVDQTLTSTSGTIADVDGLTNAVYEYQWIRVDSSNNENEIFGATGSTYVLTTTDEGQRIRVKARFIDDRSNGEMRTSGRTETVQAAVVNPPPNNPATGQPAINGTLRVDQTLTSTSGTIADVDGLTNAVYEYQWIRVDSSNNENEIFGATGSTYVLTTTDEGQRIRVKARFIDDRSNSEMRTSGRTETVQAAVVNPPPNNPATGQPAINGTLRVDQTLTSTSGTIADVDGLTNAVYEYQWIRVDSSNNENEIFGATGSTYVLTTTDEGQRIRVKARFIDDRSNGEMRTSGRTETVQAAVVNPPPIIESPVVTLLLTPQMISEDEGVSTVTAIVSPVSSEAFTVSVSAGALSPAVAGDFMLAGTTLSFAANATQSTGTVTITAVDNAVDAPDKMVRVSGTVSLTETDAPVDVTLIITDDEEQPTDPPKTETPVVTLLLTPQMISEDEGVSTVTAIVSPVSSEAFTVSVSAGALSPAIAGDFMLAGTTLSFAANATQSTGTVTITAVDNAVDAPDKMVRVSGTVSLTETDAPVDVTLIITDDEEQPTDPPKTETPVVTLLLTPQMISEDEGVSTVTAIVSPVSSEAFTVSVSAGALSPAIAGDFMLAGTTLSFAANATKSTGTVTITAVDNAVDAPDKMVRVSGTVSLSGADAPVDVTLIITDEESSPVVTLMLTPQMISEDEGVSTVTAMVSPASSEAFTVTVSASAVSPAIAGDFMLAGTTLSFAANATQSTGTVTITAVDNAVDAPDKMVRVSGTVSLTETDAPVDVTLIITDDEEQPTDPPKTETPVVTLLLTPQMISEDEGVSTVTAIVSPVSSEAFTVSVSAGALSPAIAGDFMLAGTTLSFAANATKSTGTVTITAVDNAVDAPDKMVRVSGTVSLSGADAPVDVTLIITDEESSPVVTLMLTPQMISEDEGVSTVTAMVSPASSEAFTVTVSASAVSPAVAGDFMLTGTTLSFAANATKSTGGVTITAVDNAVDSPDKMVRVSGTVSLSGADAPVDVTLIITDEESSPVVTLMLTPQMISEDEGVSTVTAMVSPASSEAFTVTVSTSAISPALAGDFMLTGTTLSFAANATKSTGGVTITAVDNAVDSPDKMVRVSGTVSLSGADAPVDVTLIITDEESSPVVTLMLTPQMISEDEGVSTVTAMVSPASSEAFTVTVSASAVSPAVAGDFMLTGTTLSFAANATKSTGGVTITAVDNAVDSPDKMVRVSGTVSLSGADAPVDVTLIITDEESSPVVTLLLTPQMISEDEGVSTVTATVSPASSEAFTVTVSASAVSPALAGDFMLTGTTLSFAANATKSTGGVTITAVDNAVDSPDKMVRVSGTVSLSGADAPVDVTLIITDEESSPVVTLLLTPQMISEDEGVSTVTATVSPASSEAFTVTVSASAVSPAVAGDFMLTGTTLSFAANATKSTGGVTITAVDNAVDSPDKMVRVSGTVSLSGADAPVDVTLIITDEESSPVVTLMLTPQMISEDEGVSTVTAMVSPASSEAFTVTVSTSAISPAVAGDFMLTGTTLSFAANATKSTGTVTITAVDNAVDSPDKMVRVSGTVSLSGADAPVDVTLIITDEESSPVVTLMLTPQMISENGGVSTVTATVSPASSEAFTVSVSALAVSPAVAGDFMLTGTTLSFAANATKSTGTVTLTAVDNAVDAPDKMVRVSGTVSLSGADAPMDVTLHITDEDLPPPELRIADATGPESGGPLVFGVSLNRSSEEQVTIDYTTVDGTAKAGVDYQAVMGTLTISAGVNHGQIEVKPLTDVLHEEDESFMIVLSNVSGAILVDGEATGLITGNDDRVTVQWLARFGRTAADHVLGAVEDQLWTQRSTRTGLTVAGQNLTDHGAATNGGVAAIAHTYGFPHGFGGGLNGGLMAAPLSMSATNGWNGLNIGHATDRNLLMSNALNLSNGSIGLGCYSLWGSGSHSRFDGSDDKLKLQGEVSSATVGSDYSCGSFLLGVALSHSSADGTIRFGDAEAATVESTLTGLYPYLRYQVSERFWFWGVTGYGTGDMTSLSASGAEREDVGLTTLLVAGGARGDLLSGAGGFSLSMKADAMVVRTRSEEDIGVIVAEGDANRRRVGLEGSHVASFENNSFLRSHVDLSLRHDSGDADKGFGLEVGGGLDWHGLMPGLTFNAGVRGLITHGADEFEEWGYSGGLRYDPTPASSQGLLLGITRSTGAPLHGGLRNTLWAEDLVLPSLPGDSRRQQQINAEFSYGFETLSGMGLPWARVGLSGPEKEYRLGYRMFTRYGVPSLEMGKTWYGRDLRLGWEFQVDCQAQIMVELMHSQGLRQASSNTGIRLQFRVPMYLPWRSQCHSEFDTLPPGTPR